MLFENELHGNLDSSGCQWWPWVGHKEWRCGRSESEPEPEPEPEPAKKQEAPGAKGKQLAVDWSSLVDLGVECRHVIVREMV
jgi:hypothetical protein